MLNNVKFDFVIVQFQTDNLANTEKCVRETDWCQSIKESERKSSEKSLLQLYSSSITVSAKKYLLEFSDESLATIYEVEKKLLQDFLYGKIEFDATQLPVLLYVTGYAEPLQNCNALVLKICFMMKEALCYNIT